MTMELCNYENSLKLREMGFNEACEYCFDTSRSSDIERQTPTNVFGIGSHNASDPYLVACPSLDEAASWIRKQHDVDIQVYGAPNTPLRFFRCFGLPFATDGVAYIDADSCRQAAVKYALRVLLGKQT